MKNKAKKEITDSIIKYQIDGIVGNVSDLDTVLTKLYDLTGLKPFLRFELISRERTVPVALIECGNFSLELLGFASGTRPKNIGYIDRIMLEIPNKEPGEFQLEPNLTIIIKSGLKARIAEIQVYSNTIENDINILQNQCGFCKKNTGSDQNLILSLSSVGIEFHPLIERSIISTEDLLKIDPNQSLHGWHRITLSCSDHKKATKQLQEAGAEILIPPYKVMPGLEESMIMLPSGIILQPVVEKLWKMLPFIMLKWIAAKILRHPIRFKL